MVMRLYGDAGAQGCEAEGCVFQVVGLRAKPLLRQHFRWNIQFGEGEHFLAQVFQ